MAAFKAKRTLVKSPPEIWAEVSDAGALARHLGEFGEIRITRTQPESIVEWEGEQASGCVRLEPSGWGTRVTLTAEPPAAEPEPEPEPVAAVPEPEPRLGFWARLFRRGRPARPASDPEPRPVAVEPEPDPGPASEPALDPDQAVAALTAVLDTLGAAHHRPFSRP